MSKYPFWLWLIVVIIMLILEAFLLGGFLYGIYGIMKGILG